MASFSDSRRSVELEESTNYLQMACLIKGGCQVATMEPHVARPNPSCCKVAFLLCWFTPQRICPTMEQRTLLVTHGNIQLKVISSQSPWREVSLFGSWTVFSISVKLSELEMEKNLEGCVDHLFANEHGSDQEPRLCWNLLPKKELKKMFEGEGENILSLDFRPGFPCMLLASYPTGSWGSANQQECACESNPLLLRYLGV